VGPAQEWGRILRNEAYMARSDSKPNMHGIGQRDEMRLIREQKREREAKRAKEQKRLLDIPEERYNHRDVPPHFIRLAARPPSPNAAARRAWSKINADQKGLKRIEKKPPMFPENICI